MPLDSIMISALSRELSTAIAGGRIDKIQQPERDMLIISLHSEGGKFRLLLSAGTSGARAHITQTSFENPGEPPMFCMLMRKHIMGARIEAVYQPELERMLIMELGCRSELGEQSRKKLIVEMIGRSSNVSLVGEDGRIIDCMRRMDFGGDAARSMLPGMIYRMPPSQSKTAFFSVTAQELRRLAELADREVPADKWLMDSFSGLSPLICRELACRCGGDYDTLPQLMDALRCSVAADELTPCMVSCGGQPRDICFMPIKQYGAEAVTEVFDSFSSLLDAFYSRRDKAAQQRRRSRELTKSVKTVRDRIQRKLILQKADMERSEGREELRQRAELITANIYRIEKGRAEFSCENYYLPGSPTVSIALDPLKSPQQNAAALFKEYGKLKTARLHLTQLIAQGEKELDYLNSVLDELERAGDERELLEIRRELTATGYLRKQNSKKQPRFSPYAPYRFLSDDGFEILVGRNNSQNDELTTKTARRTDLWMHVQHFHGSHVIIRCNGDDPPERTLEQAASLAVFYSQSRDAGKTAVDYTPVRLVRKPSGSMPGKVLYSEFKTITAAADESLAERLAAQAKDGKK